MKRLVVIPVALALLVGAMVWRSPIAGNAATINGEGIATKQINNELAAIVASPSFSCYIKGIDAIRSGAKSLETMEGSASSNSYTTAFAAQWLAQQIDAASTAQWNKAHGVVVTSDDLVQGRTDLNSSITKTFRLLNGACQGDPSTALSSLPSWFQDQLVANQANASAYLKTFTAAATTPAALEAYFLAHRTDFAGICLSVIFTADQLTANTYYQEIKAGANFEQVAKDHSLDPNSASNGGAYGCAAPGSPNYQTFKRVAGSTPAGELAPVLQTGSGYVIVKVDSRGNPTFAEVESQVRATVTNQALAAASLANRRRLRASSVTVNPIYGIWHTSSTVTVVPPVGPPKSSLLKPPA